jgi:penicillin-binding protein 2
MYGVVNEPGGTGGKLRLTGIELSGKSGTAQVIGYDKMNLVKKGSQFADNAWFVGYAPKRDPEICVAVLVQESGQHGGEAAGPVVRDIVKAYYDKKAKKTQGQLTADDKQYDLTHGAATAATIQPQPVVKPAAASAPPSAHAANAGQHR